MDQRRASNLARGEETMGSKGPAGGGGGLLPSTQQHPSSSQRGLTPPPLIAFAGLPIKREEVGALKGLVE